MTISLFSQLVRDIRSDLGPSGIQKQILTKPAAELNAVQRAGLSLFWSNVANQVSVTGANVDPSTVLAVMACLPEVHDMTDEFFFI